jgi:hypothetical protein
MEYRRSRLVTHHRNVIAVATCVCEARRRAKRGDPARTRSEARTAARSAASAVRLA